jgi:F0F1-type ATP synthase membrane subunit b/b'
MASSVDVSPDGADSLATLERLKTVETENDAKLRALRGKIDLTLSQLRDDSEAQIQAARVQVEQEAAAQLEKVQKEAAAEATRIIAETKAALAERAKSGPADLTRVWPDLLEVMFGEFH